MSHRIDGRLCALALLAALDVSAFAAEVDTSWDDGVEIDFGGRRSLDIDTRLHYDSARFDEGVTPLTDDAGMRRARVIFAGRVDDWRLRADYDFGIVDGWRNLYGQYRGFDGMQITIGHQVAPFSLDDLMSSDDLPFLERSLASALSPGMLLGASWKTWGDRWTVTAGVFENELNDQDRRNLEGTSLIGRFTYVPVEQRDRVLHFGVAHERRSVDAGEPARVRTRPESLLADNRLVSTPRLAGIENTATTGFELMSIWDNVRLQGEYLLASFDGGPNAASFSGGYAQVSWVLTGERYRYSRTGGYSTGIRPRNGRGALELSTRFSTLDLNDGPVVGGEQTQWTAGLSWYANSNFRVMLNYSVFEAAPNSAGIVENGSIVSLRFQASL